MQTDLQSFTKKKKKKNNNNLYQNSLTISVSSNSDTHLLSKTIILIFGAFSLNTFDRD